MLKHFQSGSSLSGYRMEDQLKRTPIYITAEQMLPEELHAQPQRLVAEYQFASLKHHERKFASPKVIAERILMGWRSTEVDPKGI